jgi:Fe2+ transport system protein B
MKISAMKYDQLQKQKEEIIKNPTEKEIKRPTDAYTASGGCPIEKEIITKDKKKRIIKKIIYEDGSEDEIEDMRHMHQQEQNNKYMTMFNNDSYTNLVYQSACDKLKEKVQDERTKYLIKSLMPNYG